KFVEILRPLLGRTGLERAEGVPPAESAARRMLSARSPTLVDMGCGKGYLTFAAYDLLRRTGWTEATVHGIQARSELVELCRRTARECGFGGLQFEAGTIESASLDRVEVLVELHACDAAT